MNRNHGLDFLKFVCCYFVICIHTPFPGLINNFILPISRIAVPIFFMITGYYYSHIQENNKQKKQLFRVFKLCVLGNIIYLLWRLVLNWFYGNPFIEFIHSIFNFKTIIKFIFLNESPLGGHLWYLGAIFDTLLIIYFWEKKYNRQQLYPLIPFLLLTDLILGKYSLLLLGKSIPFILVRNFLFVGLPYFLIGDMLFNSKLKINSNVLICLILFFTFTTWIERSVLSVLNLNAIRDHYLSTTFLAISVFLFALNHGNNLQIKWYQFTCFVGSKLSLNIYILHPIFIDVIYNTIRIVSINNSSIMNTYNYVASFIVFLVSIIISYMLYTIKNVIKPMNKYKND